jgi:superfamily II DNA or RNA helicase
MDAKLITLGRAVLLTPASLGARFEEDCTVTRMIEDPPCQENGWRRSQIPHVCAMYKYDVDKTTGERLFVAYSGYYERIRKKLIEQGVSLTIESRMDSGLGTPDLDTLKSIEWRPGQAMVVSKILAHPGGVIKCPTGFGKTFICRALTRAYPKAKIAITVPSKDVAQKIYFDLANTMGADNVGMIGDGARKIRTVNVVISKSLHHLDQDINLLLCDECHSLLTLDYIKALNRFHRAKIFGFTATPTGRSDKSDGFMEAVFGPIIADVSYQEGVAAGNIVQLHAEIYRCESGPNVAGLSDKVYADRIGIWQNVHRNNMIASIAKAKTSEHNQVLIMVDKTEHAYMLSKLLPEFQVITGDVDKSKIARFAKRGIVDENIVTCSSSDREKYRLQFETGELKYAIATRIWSKGVDFRNLSCLIRADGLASPIDAGQIPGRLSRISTDGSKKFGVLVDFYDVFSKNLENRSRQRLRVYRSNGWKVDFCSLDMPILKE